MLRPPLFNIYPRMNIAICSDPKNSKHAKHDLRQPKDVSKGRNNCDSRYREILSASGIHLENSIHVLERMVESRHRIHEILNKREETWPGLAERNRGSLPFVTGSSGIPSNEGVLCNSSQVVMARSFPFFPPALFNFFFRAVSRARRREEGREFVVGRREFVKPGVTRRAHSKSSH